MEVGLREIIEMTMRILEGLGVTLSVYIVTLGLSLPIGMLLAIWRVSTKKKAVVNGINFYTWVLRGTPLMLQLFFVYYGLRGVSWAFGDYMIRPFGFLNAFSAAVLAYVVNYSAYFTEIFRGGIQAMDKGQYEAAKALGLSYGQSMRYVIMPQAMRSVLPSLTNEAITLVKDTALVAAIAMGDLLRNAKEIVMSQGTLLPFLIVAIIYLILASGIIALFRSVERKYEFKMG
ncbi:MAG: amino acid ABC transporter permease [Cellulosilyticaceae bacterium]